MSDLPPGLYEELVTNDLDRRFRLVDPALGERDRDPGDAHEILARRRGAGEALGEALSGRLASGWSSTDGVMLRTEVLA